MIRKVCILTLVCVFDLIDSSTCTGTPQPNKTITTTAPSTLRTTQAPPKLSDACAWNCFWVDLIRENGTLYKDNGTTTLTDSDKADLSGMVNQDGLDYGLVFKTGSPTSTAEEVNPIQNELAFALCEYGNGLVKPAKDSCPCGWTFIYDTCIAMTALRNASPKNYPGAAAECNSIGGVLLRNYGALKYNPIEIDMLRPGCPQGWTTVLSANKPQAQPYCYKQFSDMTKSWMDAEKHCQSIDSHLATFSDLYAFNGFPGFAELYCRSGLFSSSPVNRPYWIGYNDYADNGRLIYADYSYLPLQAPYVSIINDTAMPSQPSARYCILWDGGAKNIKTREDCFARHPFICQKDLQPRVNTCPNGLMFGGNCLFVTSARYSNPATTGQAECTAAAGTPGATLASFHTLTTWTQFLRYW